MTVTVASEEDITEAEKEEIDDEEEAISADPYEPIPFVNLLSAETSRLTHENFVKFDDKRWKVTKLATAQNPFYQLLEVDLNGESLDNTINVDAKTLSVVNNWDLGTKFDITLTTVPETRFTDKDRVAIRYKFETLVTLSEQELYDVKSKVKTEDDQEKLNKTINLKITPFDEWTDTNYQVANHMINQIQELNAIKSGEVEEKDFATEVAATANQ